jgi:hypothetical protein
MNNSATKQLRSTAGALQAHLGSRGIEGDDENRRLVGGLVACGGIGNPIPYGSVCSVVCTTANVMITAEGTDYSPFVHPLHDVVGFEAGGPGAVKTNAGVIGGGFGLEGAVEGMLIAAALNKLSTKTTVTTTANLETRSVTYKFVTNLYLPQQIGQMLAPINKLIYDMNHAARNKAPGTESGNSPLEQLEQLAKLHQSGILSDEEYESTKARILASIG